MKRRAKSVEFASFRLRFQSGCVLVVDMKAATERELQGSLLICGSLRRAAGTTHVSRNKELRRPLRSTDIPGRRIGCRCNQCNDPDVLSQRAVPQSRSLESHAGSRVLASNGARYEERDECFRMLECLLIKVRSKSHDRS